MVRRGERVTSSVTLAPAAVSHPAVNPWFVATAVVVPTFMEILDTTIATASLRQIAVGSETGTRLGSETGTRLELTAGDRLWTATEQETTVCTGIVVQQTSIDGLSLFLRPPLRLATRGPAYDHGRR